MKFKKFGNKWILRIDKGEEVIQTIKKLCEDNKIKLGSLSGIGATDRATIGLFNTKSKQYQSRELM